MDTALSIMVLCEVLITLFVVWGFLHERSFVRLEHAIARAARQKLRTIRRRREAAARRRINRKAVYSPAVTAKNRGEVSVSRAA